jgi:class 3 adenylate cyclase
MNDYLLRFVTPRVAKLLKKPVAAALEKAEKQVAILFVDIAGCTRLCEKLPPREMNNLIEFYFTRFLDVIQEIGGAVNEIMGDGFMAIFEGKTYEENIHDAIAAAVRIKRLTAELKRQSSRNGYDTHVHIGMHAGKAFVGFTKFRAKRWERWTYTASGPVTNIAARLCQYATTGAILVSSEVAAAIKERYRLKRLGPLKLKNVSQAVEVYRVHVDEI